MSTTEWVLWGIILCVDFVAVCTTIGFGMSAHSVTGKFIWYFLALASLTFGVVIAISAFVATPENPDNLRKSEEKRQREEELSSFLSQKDPFEKLVFGSYEQDGDTSNGAEPIEWYVIKTDGEKSLLISKFALDNKPCDEDFQINNIELTWENSSLREWLNADFYNSAFSNTEKENIIASKVSADKSPLYDSNPGNDTNDKIFLLSYNEATQYFRCDEDRKCVPTAYAIKQGALRYDGITCDWWMRTPGGTQTPGSIAPTLTFVNTEGLVGAGGSANNTGRGVRPAVWVTLHP